MTHTCQNVECKKEFESKRRDAKFCSDACRMNVKRNPNLLKALDQPPITEEQLTGKPALDKNDFGYLIEHLYGKETSSFEEYEFPLPLKKLKHPCIFFSKHI